MNLRPLLGHLRHLLSDEARRQAVDVGKATLRTIREDVRELPEHLRDVRKERGK